ncbi:transcriptional regulator, luxR/uhpA-family [Mycobacterium tuberculosis T17]|nr:transcriptional regulator, luxR/uhpA-family [Mycobacterium tuberculosis T17]
MSKLLPRGTVTLLWPDVEGSTWLWETHPDDMGAAVARLDKAVSGVIAAHDGVRPVEQGEGDSFVLAFVVGAVRLSPPRWTCSERGSHRSGCA